MLLCWAIAPGLAQGTVAPNGNDSQATGCQIARSAEELHATVGKSLIIDCPIPVVRVSVGNAEIAGALAVTPREVLVNAKARGETTLIIWQEDGKRLMFDVTVTPSTAKADAINRLITEMLKVP